MKKHVCLLLSLLLLFSAVSPAYAAGSDTLTLASYGATEYRIVTAENAIPAERTAAETLARYLREITGASFPVVTDSEAPAEKEIAVGVTNRDAFSPTDRTNMDDDAVRIFTAGRRLYLTGGAARGALYAVYTFLEDWLGCRWFTHDLTLTPQTDVLTLEPVDYFYEPCFKLRQTYWMFSAMYADYCAAHKLHGVMAYLPEELGGGRYEMAVNSVHTMGQIVPQSLFGAHPEYFGADASGTRSPNLQPCLRNEEVFRRAVAYAMDYFSQYNAVLSVSQNDGMDFCQCEACKAFNAAHGGTDSAALLDFVNRVAAEVKKTYPEAKIETLAYQNSQKPPAGLTVADNVVIRLCAMNTCTLHALDDPACPPNAAFNADFSGWAALTDRLYIWDYSTNFQYYYALYPNITALQGRYRYFRDRNVIAVFDHGCGEVAVPGELHELRTYLVLKLLWDPDTDVDRHISEFCEAYYGAAAPDVIEFIHTFETGVKGYNALSVSMCHMACSDGGENIEAHTSLTESDIKNLNAIMARAKARDLTEAEAYRLHGLELSWRLFKNATFAGEFNWFSYRYNPEEEAEKLFNDLKAYGVTFLAEAGNIAFGDRTPNFRVRPTYWFLPESELPASVKFQSKVLPIINRLMRTFFFLPRLLQANEK
jgi:hypothetical protein